MSNDWSSYLLSVKARAEGDAPQDMGGFIVPGWMYDYLVALDAYEHGQGPKPVLPQEIRRTRWERVRSWTAGRLYGAGHRLSDWIAETLQNSFPSFLVERDWPSYVAAGVTRPLFWLGWLIDIDYTGGVIK